jgi:hypothetical protein
MSKAEPKAADISSVLLSRHPLPPLWPQKVWRDDLRGAIEGHPGGPLVKAVLHLLNDDLNAAHQIVQEAGSPDANYLHALVHRREGDFSNARYWLRTLSTHRVWDAMRREFPEWEPLKFLVWCESCAEGCQERRCDWLQQVQARELQILLASL